MNSGSPWRSLLRHARPVQQRVRAPKRGAAGRATSSTELMARRHKAGYDDHRVELENLTRISLTILLTSDERLHALNKAFRGKDKATNVLSFPSGGGDDGYLGDIAIAFDVARKEARQSRKPFANHVTHLAVHGVLHLLGYDHETAREAKIMEPLEVSVLKALGIADPYRRRKNVA
jgi:probable rRNA maturation factor